jgi:hypothetical protein
LTDSVNSNYVNVSNYAIESQSKETYGDQVVSLLYFSLAKLLLVYLSTFVKLTSSALLAIKIKRFVDKLGRGYHGGLCAFLLGTALSA